jgi:DNA-binding HxlR family transcriptional regulator
VRHADVQQLNCSIARTVGVLGERWTLLVLRQAFLRTRRFEDFQRTMGVARNVLADRLQKLVEHGILERRLYQERPERYEYRLTEKGRDLYPVVVAIMRWGDRHTAGDAGAPVVLVHERCGHLADPYLACAHCGEEIDAREMRPEPGPGALVEEPDAA